MARKKSKKRDDRKVARRMFKESLSYIFESRNYIYFAIILFLVSAVFAFIFPNNFSFFDEILRDIAMQVQGLGALELVIFIFRNNFTSALMALIFGIFLGVFPIINAFSNGAVLGYVFARASEVAGIGVFWRILPHGIFELPAIFIALGMGMRLGTFIFAGKDKMKSELAYRLDRSLKTVVMVILPLLVIAAIIEGMLIFVLG